MTPQEIKRKILIIHARPGKMNTLHLNKYLEMYAEAVHDELKGLLIESIRKIRTYDEDTAVQQVNRLKRVVNCQTRL